MAKGLIKKAFRDKYTGIYHNPGQTVEFTDARLKELVGLGYVESREKTVVKAEVKSEVKPEVKPEPEKKPAPAKTTKKK